MRNVHKCKHTCSMPVSSNLSLKVSGGCNTKTLPQIFKRTVSLAQKFLVS